MDDILHVRDLLLLHAIVHVVPKLSSLWFLVQYIMGNEAHNTAENSDNFEFEANQSLSDDPGSHRWRKVTATTAVTLVVVLTLVLAARGTGGSAAGSSSSNLTSVKQTTVPYPAPVFTPPGSVLDPLPTHCTTTTTTTTKITNKTEPEEITYYAGPAYGLSPIWVLGLSNQQNRYVVLFESYPSLPYTSHGWRWRILLVSAPNYDGAVTLSGEETGDGGGAAVLMDAGTGLATELSLNASQPIMRGVGWAEWPIYVYLPKPGCYEIGAHWSNGNWNINFAAGV